MKKIIITATVIAAACITQASLVNWIGNFETGAGADDGFTYNGQDFQAGWSVYLFEGSTLFSGDKLATDFAGNAASTQVEFNLGGPIPGHAIRLLTVANVSLTDNADIFTVLFNSSSVASASKYLVLETSVANAGAFDPATTYTPTYSVGSTGTIQLGTQEWQSVVPEPATIGLFGLGALSAWVIRRNKLKAREEV